MYVVVCVCAVNSRRIHLTGMADMAGVLTLTLFGAASAMQHDCTYTIAQIVTPYTN